MAGTAGFVATFAILLLALSSVGIGAENQGPASQQQKRPAIADGQSTEPSERSIDAKARKHTVPASELIGSKVKNLDDEEVGEVVDLIVRSDSGEVPYAVVDFGGPLDFTGDDQFAIPFEALEHSHEDGACVLNVNMVRELPGDKEKADWLEVSEDEDAQREQTPLGDYWIEQSPEAEEKIEHRSMALSAKAILGAKVQNIDGEEIGKLYELIVDLDEGHAVNTVFAAGGIFGLGQEHYLLPWKALSHSRENGNLVAGVTKEMLEAMPRYEGDKEPRVESPPPVPGS